MDVDELIASAWGAVKKAGVSEAVQAVAFKEAVDFLVGDRPAGSDKLTQESRSHPKRRPNKTKDEATDSGGGEPDAEAFYSQLADESGVDEAALRDVLQLKGSAIHVIPPTRMFGDTKANQMRQIVALVAGAFAHGLDRSPVDAVAVRDELKRKRCFDPANFAARVRAMKGFSQGSDRNEILVGSKWLGEFEAAIKLATGASDSNEE
jgi:hypothetical protein